jgi:hypothetical protein
MRPRLRLILNIAVFIGALFVLVQTCSAQVNVTMQRYDHASTGANLSEYQLNTSNVNSAQFGKLFSYANIDGSTYAQPLYVSGVTIPGKGKHNVLYVVTMNDVVYALDADSNATNGGVLWFVDYKVSGSVAPIPITDIVGSNTLNIVGNVGIESTPVIDLSTNTIYFVARTKETSTSGTITYVTRLHALDITNGAEKFGSPKVVQGSVPGTGNGSTGGVLPLDSLIDNQRSSLSLVNGNVLFAYASHEDFGDRKSVV